MAVEFNGLPPSQLQNIGGRSQVEDSREEAKAAYEKTTPCSRVRQAVNRRWCAGASVNTASPCLIATGQMQISRSPTSQMLA